MGCQHNNIDYFINKLPIAKMFHIFFGKSQILVMFTDKGKSLSEVPEIFKMISMVFIILSLNI